MPNIIRAQPIGTGFHGLREIYQYTNDDGLDPGTVCGQAASATLLTERGAQRPQLATLREIERTHHPDLFGGRLGTSPWRVEAILRAYGATGLQHIHNEDELKRSVAANNPVVCLIQNVGGLRGLFSSGAHWFVVFAYDEQGVFVTNYGGQVHLTWADFRQKWNSMTSWFASADFKGITATARVNPTHPTPPPTPPTRGNPRRR
jgi:hypothetical protein